MRLSKREVILLILLLLTGILYLFYIYVYSPIRDKTDVLQAENAGLETAVRTEKNSIEKYNNLEEEKLKQDYALLAEKIPAAPFIPEIIAYMEKSADDAGVNLLAVDYTEDNRNERRQNKDNGDKAETSLQQLQFQISAVGSYPELLLFLLQIEKTSRLYVMESTAMKTTKKKAVIPPPVTVTAEGEPPAAVLPPVVLTGSSAYDPENIEMDIVFIGYYDTNSLPGISGGGEKVQPGEGRINPFTR